MKPYLNITILNTSTCNTSTCTAVKPLGTLKIATGKPGEASEGQGRWRRFPGRHADYLRARDHVLQAWDADVTRFLTLEACLGARPLLALWALALAALTQPTPSCNEQLPEHACREDRCIQQGRHWLYNEMEKLGVWPCTCRMDSGVALYESWQQSQLSLIGWRLSAEGIEEGGDLAGIIPEAYRFLLEQGCINIGVPAGEPAHAKAGDEGAGEDEGGVSEEALVAAVYALLKKVDMEVGGGQLWLPLAHTQLNSRRGCQQATVQAGPGSEHVIQPYSGHCPRLLQGAWWVHAGS
jgi:hypothetical protein